MAVGQADGVDGRAEFFGGLAECIAVAIGDNRPYNTALIVLDPEAAPVWAAAQGSERLHRWLLAHRDFGPMIRDWHDHGAVTRRSKWMATGAMVALTRPDLSAMTPANWAWALTFFAVCGLLALGLLVLGAALAG